MKWSEPAAAGSRNESARPDDSVVCEWCCARPVYGADAVMDGLAGISQRLEFVNPSIRSSIQGNLCSRLECLVLMFPDGLCTHALAFRSLFTASYV
jgi:hypothetical protein